MRFFLAFSVLFTSSAIAYAQDSGGADVMAMCSTSLEGGPRIITNIAPIKAPANVSTPRAMKEKLQYRAAETMLALGMTSYQNVGCIFMVPGMPLQDGNQTEKDMIDYQRRLIETHGYKVVAVNRLDAGAAVKKGAGSAPPDIHDDGAALRFYYAVGLVPTAADTRNPMCVSNVITSKDKVDWKEWGSSGRADELAAPFRAAFIAACRRVGSITSEANVYPVFDRDDGQFKYAPHATDRVVRLP